jgi:ribosomal protein L37AE/L43A
MRLNAIAAAQRAAAVDNDPECKDCGELFSLKRFNLGYKYCLVCGERASRKVKHTIVPLPKSNYVYAHSAADVISPYSHKGNR